MFYNTKEKSFKIHFCNSQNHIGYRNKTSMHNSYYVFSYMMAANLHNIYIHIEHIMINTLVRIMFMIMRAIYVTTVSSQKNSIVASIVAWCVRFASHHIDFWPHGSQWGDIVSEREVLFPSTSP